MYNEMSNEELEEIKENLETQICDLLDTKEHLFKALNDIPKIPECEDLTGYMEECIKECENLMESIGNDIKDIIDLLDSDRLYDDYDERQREYREMQGF